ncbi:transglutaminaseTgpA domain-containing protein [Vulgatibacter sp.]|uniref:transglutaminaseTgpA domain-containing protein n=1 Tax=Vulgatibacter sp. TaxID=1971226 RepID=UPI00356A23D0
MEWGRLQATARLWWRMMRMQRVTREGWFYVGFTLVVGAAAINTGNNLLYLVLGLQLSLVLLSALLSETALRGIEVARELPRHAVAGQPFRAAFVLRNHKRRFASYSLVVSELQGPAAGVRVFVARVPARSETRALYEAVVPRRGEGAFATVRITTRFPFGLFEKSREQEVPGLLPIHPAPVRAPAAKLGPLTGEGERPEPLPGNGHDFHALREWRSGDDPRQIHWRSTARTGRPVVIERERERRRRVSLLVDTRGLSSSRAVDGVAEAALSLARRFLESGCEVGLAWNGGALPPGAGPSHLRRIGDAVAALHPTRADMPAPKPFQSSHAVPVPAATAAPLVQAKVVPVHEGPAGDSRGKLTLHGMQRAALLAAVVAGFASLAISGELPVWAVGGFVVAAILGLLLREGAAQGVRNASNVVALGALLVLAFQVVSGAADVIVAAPTFAVALAASRLLGRRGPADDALLLLSALLMLAGGAALTGDLSYGLAFAAFAVTATVALCLSHLRRETEEVDGPHASKRRGTVSGNLVGALAVLSVTVLAGSAVVFVMFPRVSAGMIRRAMEQRVGGGSDRIQLGGVGVLKEDPTPVLRVRFPEGEPASELYWRTMVFDRWDGRGWTRPAGGRTPIPTAADGIYRFAPVEQGAVVAEVEVLGGEPGLPSPGEPLEVRFPRKPRETPPILLEAPGGTLEVRREGGGNLRYRIAAAPRPRADELQGRERRYPPPEVARYLEIPAGLDPKVRELALRVGGDADPLRSAEALVEHLERGYRYTRELPGEVPDPIAHFLFERKAGHCEFFASALALMLRINGVPARVAAGYYGASFVEGGDYWLVRQGDAHAWTEAWFPGSGWVRFDATPAEVRPGELGGTWASVVEWVDVLRVRWSDWVLDFDTRSQVQIASAIAQAFSRQEGAGRDLARPVRFLGAALCLGAAGWLGLRLRRRLLEEAGRKVPPHHKAAVRLFREVKRSLRRRGVKLPESATAAEWAEAAARVAPERANAVRAAVDAYERTRFGGRPLDGERAASLRRALR